MLPTRNYFPISLFIIFFAVMMVKRLDIKTVRAVINQWVFGACTHFIVFSLNDIDLRILQMYLQVPKARFVCRPLHSHSHSG